ncbi:MAG: dipeptidase [Clostridiales bacterium]|jgi:membrane dipeptidase|nr:dipeptidase [Clostridiales bacterium]
MYPLFDAHCDAPTEIFRKNEDLLSNSGHVDIKRLLAFKNPAQVFAVWLDPKLPREGGAFESAARIISFFGEQIVKYKDFISRVTSPEDLAACAGTGKIAALLAVEGGEPLEGKLENLSKLREMGVCSITLTWNDQNELGCGCLGGEAGLTPFGFEALREARRLGMTVDISHLSEAGCRDVLGACKAPVIASHSNAAALCRNKRNLSDEIIRDIAEKGGVVGATLYPPFLAEAKVASIPDVLRHVNYMVNLAGAEHVGLGCDFDGIEQTPADLRDLSAMPRLLYALELMLGAETAEKVASKNFFRVFMETLKTSPGEKSPAAEFSTASLEISAASVGSSAKKRKKIMRNWF